MKITKTLTKVIIAILAAGTAFAQDAEVPFVSFNWSQASPEKPAEEGAAGAPSLLEVKGEKEVTADDIYQAMMDVCGEQISLFDETCKTLEENSRAVADSLILNHGEVKQVCDTVGLCWDGLLTTYKSWEVAHPPSVRRL